MAARCSVMSALPHAACTPRWIYGNPQRLRWLRLLPAPHRKQCGTARTTKAAALTHKVIRCGRTSVVSARQPSSNAVAAVDTMRMSASVDPITSTNVTMQSGSNTYWIMSSLAHSYFELALTAASHVLAAVASFLHDSLVLEPQGERQATQQSTSRPRLASEGRRSVCWTLAQLRDAPLHTST